MAVPRKGAEQGVLKRTSSAPVKKAPASPALCPAASILVVAFHGSQISKMPKKLMANAVKITTMKAMKPALWNCMPQPADPPPALTAATTAASTQKLTRIPAVVAPPKARSRPRLSPACLIRLNNLRESTGSTHGIRFRIIPPIKAKNNSANTPARFSEATLPRSPDATPSRFPDAFPSTSESFFFAVPSKEPLSVAPSMVNLLADFAAVPFPADFPSSRIVLLAGAKQIELSHAW